MMEIALIWELKNLGLSSISAISVQFSRSVMSDSLRPHESQHVIDYRLVNTAAAAAAKSLQSCLTLCDAIDSSPAGSPVPGTLQARTLEWVAISFSNA